MSQRQLLPRSIRRAIAVIFLVPFGTICLLFPFFYLFMGRVGTELLTDTKGMLGFGQPTAVRVHQVSCFSRRYGTGRTGMTEWDCSIYPATGPRIERTCAFNRTNKIPTLRIVSTDPFQYAVSWGPWELLSRYIFTLGFPMLIVFGFGFACLYATRYTWNRP